MYSQTDVHGNPIRTSDDKTTFIHPTQGEVVQGDYGPQPVNQSNG